MVGTTPTTAHAGFGILASRFTVEGCIRFGVTFNPDPKPQALACHPEKPETKFEMLHPAIPGLSRRTPPLLRKWFSASGHPQGSGKNPCYVAYSVFLNGKALEP